MKTLIRLLLRKQSDLGLHCLLRPFSKVSSVHNFRTFTLFEKLTSHELASFISVLKSDNANGVFSFAQPCQPARASTELDIITCTVSRQRGDDGSVMVTWAIYEILLGQEPYATTDFVDYTGSVVFQPGERSKVSYVSFSLSCSYIIIIIIIRFLINVQVQGHHPHQWAPFQVTG